MDFPAFGLLNIRLQFEAAILDFIWGNGGGNGNNLCTLVVSNEMQMISVRLENVQDK